MVTLKDANSIRSGTVGLTTCLLRAPKAGYACAGDEKLKPVYIRNDGKAAEDCYEQRDAWLCLPALVWFGEGVRLLYQIIDATEKADLVALLGTSDNVHLVAGLIGLDRKCGAPTEMVPYWTNELVEVAAPRT